MRAINGGLIRDKTTGLLILYGFPNYTKFQGFYDIANYKHIDYLGIETSESEVSIKKLEVNNRKVIAKKSKKGIEVYWLKNGLLFYEYFPNKEKKEIEIILDLDHRHIKSFPIWGRYYSVQEKGAMISIDYKLIENNNIREEKSTYIAIGKDSSIEIPGWIEKLYEYDRKRNSKHDLWVYRIKIRKKAPFRIVIGLDSEKKTLFNYGLWRGLKREDVINEWEKQEKYEKDLLKLLDSLVKIHDKHGFSKVEVGLLEKARKNVAQTILEFMDNERLIAGYPYFIEEWIRDELLALRALMINPSIPEEFVANILRRIFKLIKSSIENNDYRLPSINTMGSIKSCDAPYYYWCRLIEYLETYGIKNKGKGLTLIEIREMLGYLPRFLRIAEQKGMEKIGIPLPYCEEKESWVDTCGKCGCRKGIPIELALIHLKLYESMIKIKHNDLLKDSIDINLREIQEKSRSLFNTIHELFIKRLRDSFPDRDFITPNIFLGIYNSPGVLSRGGIDKIIRKMISCLWLPWGGVSSIDINHPCFQEKHTGEDNKSYHSGDSWFFMNNIVGIIMYSNNPERYKHYTYSILKASIKDYYREGLHMACSEISSANMQTSYGCHSQLWSATTLYELLSLILKKYSLNNY
ncbi:hypothetical protein J7K74_00035 [Candidatus Woesearchaeota archaeon]|nr:hypothetical protein [Candidatus Woesearchaeota archaeon]